MLNSSLAIEQAGLPLKRGKAPHALKDR